MEFNYGIDANFDGQLLFEDLPEGLRRKPTLVAKIYSDTDNSGNLSLAYLTNGISWRANYVANVIDNTKLDLTAWVTINNESGIDYNNANVQLVAGQINQTRSNSAYFGEMRAMAVAAPKMAMADGIEIAQEDISAYHLYTLPNKTTIKDKQTKQITLMERNAVKYTKEAELTSPLHFFPNSDIEFKNKHLSMYYNLINNTASNLGVQLPAGTIRFYENDTQGNLQFIGENTITHTAKEEKMHLYLGDYGNIFANGKISKITKLDNEQIKTDSESCSIFYTPYSYEAEIKVYNSGKTKEQIKIKQNIPQDAEIISQNIKGQSTHSGMYEWTFSVAPESNQTLTFTLKAPHIRKRTCNK